MYPDDSFTTGRFSWQVSAPLLGPERGGADPQVAVKDPTLVFDQGFWNLYATVRFASGRVDIVGSRFKTWADAATAPRHVLALHDKYYCAPQLFFYTPQKRWFLIYQLADDSRTPPFQPCYSTTTDLSDLKSWSKPQPLMANPPAKPKWLDFWVICDTTHAHLFWTSLDGKLWRAQTEHQHFPGGVWSAPTLALQADIFEASHTYKLKGRSPYLTIVEAQGKGRRYFKAYLADTLTGPWKPLADSWEKPFAGLTNCPSPWTTNISHGELLRSRNDETLEIDPQNLQFLFQGASDTEYRTAYGKIPWKLGLLTVKP
ncbi:non-reducing end alpha-L-arabinofuranosidase family hydrolase [Armatimonas rosea]|uniref:non-reducing end alpha-L-arabinofuranosidase n=1 Tax=Armatimonas rosea TaxID=685828 RepID=A0A7W9SVU6_ARMRO|nr:non-reducing end alpha-L-arabinofuranosidase family hydrolase [Armatimonas rosea]MBB6053333.1 hypothetical protein [Armatimonas rosea]